MRELTEEQMKALKLELASNWQIIEGFKPNDTFFDIEDLEYHTLRLTNRYLNENNCKN